jgi:hypothetical protein
MGLVDLLTVNPRYEGDLGVAREVMNWFDAVVAKTGKYNITRV